MYNRTEMTRRQFGKFVAGAATGVGLAAAAEPKKVFGMDAVPVDGGYKKGTEGQANLPQEVRIGDKSYKFIQIKGSTGGAEFGPAGGVFETVNGKKVTGPRDESGKNALVIAVWNDATQQWLGPNGEPVSLLRLRSDRASAPISNMDGKVVEQCFPSQCELMPVSGVNLPDTSEMAVFLRESMSNGTVIIDPKLSPERQLVGKIKKDAVVIPYRFYDSMIVEDQNKEITHDGEPTVQVGVRISASKQFLEQTGIADIILGDFDDLHVLALEGAFQGWVSDDRANRGSAKRVDWLNEVKAGKGKLTIPAVDETDPKASVTKLQLKEWGPKFDQVTGKVVMDVGIHYAGRDTQEPTPIHYARSGKNSFNGSVLIGHDGRLTFVENFVQTEALQRKTGWIKPTDSPAVVANKVGGRLSDEAANALTSRFSLNHDLSTNSKAEPIPYDTGSDAYLAPLREKAGLRELNHTVDNYTDDQPAIIVTLANGK